VRSEEGKTDPDSTWQQATDDREKSDALIPES
jgi:hypothetical protein